MPGQSIPEREPIRDIFDGFLLKIDTFYLLSVEAAATAEVIAKGTLTVRYGVRFLGKPHLAIVPGLIALDYGEMLTGEAAWEFLFKRSNLYPRADVLGYRNDGQDEMIVVKRLDLTEPLMVLIYDHSDAIHPLAETSALIGPSEHFPPRLVEYLPCFMSIAEWRQHIE